MEDKEIVGLFLNRDEAAIKQTDAKYGKRLWSISNRIIDNSDDADECLNDTYMKAWNNIPPNEPFDYLFPFLAKIIRNITINRCNEKGRGKRRAYITELSKELEECIPDTKTVEYEFTLEEVSESINRYLKKQPREKRIIFVHRYYFCTSIKDIADRFGYSEGKIKTLLYRMRNELRELLREEELYE